MIRTFLLFLGLAALAMPAAAAERRYSVTDFDRVVVEGPYVVRLTVGGPSSAVATGPQLGIDRILVDVSGTTLRIRRNRNAWGGPLGQGAAQEGIVEVALSTRNLRSVRVVGPGRVELAGARGLQLDLILEGSGEIRATGLDVDNLALGLRGSGRLALAGRAGSLRGDFQGTGEVAASALASENVTLGSTLLGPVVLNASRTARIVNNGLGEVTVGGRPACTLTGPGASQVRCGEPAAR